jgi:hypothetical protein
MHRLLKINTTYQGAPLTEKFFNEHPEIHELFPSKDKFMNEIYLPLLKKAEESKTEYVVEISEAGISINGIMQ